jgi:hypothetical protein
VQVELTYAGHLDVGPEARRKLSGLIKYYMQKPHPFTACVRDNTKRFGPEGAKRVCATLKDIGEGDNTHWRKGGRSKAAWTDGAVETMLAAIDSSAIDVLQESRPQLTTVPGVQVIKTGIEYPLSTGPTTFTPEDLASAVNAQQDPSIPQPRIWIGHPDDERIHGKRGAGVASGEPAVGKVTDMRLVEEGHTIVGDLTGVPLWLANIMGSAFPSRSIEGRFNVKTPTGKKHRLVISGLTLLGVTWPGVLTIEDIASLYTEEGPGVVVTESTPELPVAMAAVSGRQIVGQVNVEDLRRAWHESIRGDGNKRNWWMRSIYVEPNEVIIDADDGGTLLRQPFRVSGNQVAFGEAKRVKVQYVNASHGGIEAEPINENRQHVATFEQHTLDVDLAPGINVKLGG